MIFNYWINMYKYEICHFIVCDASFLVPDGDNIQNCTDAGYQTKETISGISNPFCLVEKSIMVTAYDKKVD